jgi:hypothetical protein
LTPYYALKNAVHHRGGICSAWEVRRELQNYLGQFKVKCPIKWSEVMTREEWFASVNKKKRKPRRKKGEADPVKHVFTTVEGVQLELRGHHVKLDEEHDEDLDWIDALARRQELELEADAYHGEF